MEFQLQAPTRKCSRTGRDLKPGDRYYGLLLEQGDRFVRHEFATDAWEGAPSEAIAYWLGRVPGDETPRRPPMDDDVLMTCFRRLADAVEASRINLRYIIALLLVRRKRLKLEDTRLEPTGEVLMLRDGKTNETFEVSDPGLSEAEMTAAQNEVYQVLGWD